jgi:hypothetical protein
VNANLQPPVASWRQIRFATGKPARIAEFEGLDDEKQMQRLTRSKEPCSRDDHSKLLHTLTAQIVLICFLGFNTASQPGVYVRGSGKPQNTVIGKSINFLKAPNPLGQTSGLCSWYQWIRSISPRDLDCGCSDGRGLSDLPKSAARRQPQPTWR